VIKLIEKQEIISMHIKSISNRKIALKLGVSKDTVNKYVNEYDKQKAALLFANPQMDSGELIHDIVDEPKYHAGIRESIKLTPEIKSLIEECIEHNRQKRTNGMKKQVMKKIDIHKYLLDKGHNISYSSVKRACNGIINRHAEAFVRQEYFPGDVCEFDWGTVKLNIGQTGYQKYQMAVFTPAYSGIKFAMLFKAQDTTAFQESHAEFFEWCKGNYTTMVYDNMRVAVAKFIGATEKEPTKALLGLSIYYGFDFRFCNICRGNEKGHVERNIEYIHRKVFSPPGNDIFETLDDANIFLLRECEKLNNVMTYNKSVPVVLFEEEQKHLNKRLPKFECCIENENKVDKYSTISISQNRYSVPDTLVGKAVTAKVYTGKITIFHDNKMVALHKRSYKNHDWIINIYHYLRTLKKKSGALSQSTALLQVDTMIKHIYNSYYTTEPKIFLDVLEIIKEKGVYEVKEALKVLENLSPKDMNADKIRVVCDKREEERNQVSPEYIDHISETSRKSLTRYDILTAIQSGKIKKGVIS
jgi:transposase